MNNLLGLDRGGLERFFEALGEKPFRARQVVQWVHQRGEDDFGKMSDLAKSLRERLVAVASVQAPVIVADTTAADGTRKWLLKVDGANAVEAVFIPETSRGKLCVSRQAGCVLDCAFCSTGKQGFNRNLSVAEIIGQLWFANRVLGAAARAPHTDDGDGRIISNVVMMGMGEPLANFDNVVAAMRLMLDDNAYGLSRRRVTLSTAGLVPGIDRLREACPVALAVSLHAPSDALRDQLVPINRNWPIRELPAACLRYVEKAPRESVMFEYVMLEGCGHLGQLDQPDPFNAALAGFLVDVRKRCVISERPVRKARARKKAGGL